MADLPRDADALGPWVIVAVDYVDFGQPAWVRDRLCPSPLSVSAARPYSLNQGDKVAKLLVPQRFSKNEPVHIARLKEVAKWRLPPENSQEWVDFRLRTAAAAHDPGYRKELKALSRTARHTCFAVEHNGAGLPADEGVREFLAEYNRRTGNYGLHYLPSSFNVFEAFSEYIPKYGVFVPLPERDHICSLQGFLEFQASAEPNVDKVLIPEDEIHNYSFVETPGEWQLDDRGGAFAICSISLVRHGDELSALCLGGIQRDLSAETKAILDRGAEVFNPPPDKPLLVVDQSQRVEAVPLDREARFQRAYFGLRYDLNKRRAQVRYIFFDEGRSWNVRTDDEITFDNAHGAADGDLEKWTAKLEEHSGVFEFLARLFSLPTYFANESQRVNQDKAVTALADANARATVRRKFEASLRPQVQYERQVFSLLPTGNEPSEMCLSPLELEVEVEGYWERLPFGTYGTSETGERVLGRTWVRKTISRRSGQMVHSPTVIRRSEASVSLKNDEGYIYVLRNAAHHLDVFKIGLTRRSVVTRAAELSRGTGIPDVFLTVQAWWVPDVVFAEKRIHQILDEYRLKDSREFFRADYSAIRSAVDMVVSELAGRSVPA